MALYRSNGGLILYDGKLGTAEGCCCVECPDFCDGNGVPTTLEAAVSAAADLTCDTCDQLDYPDPASAAGGFCSFDFGNYSPTCAGRNPQIAVTIRGINRHDFVIEATLVIWDNNQPLAINGTTAFYRLVVALDPGGTIDCTAFAIDLPFVSQEHVEDGVCDFTGTTVRITTAP